MAHLIFLLFTLLTLATTSYSAATKPSPPSDFIKSSCRATRYPALCVDSLAAYTATIRQSPKQIAQAALTVSLSKAQSAKAYVIEMRRSKGLKAREAKAMKDCVDNMGESVDRLSKSIGELGRMGGRATEESFLWHMSNVQTWVSAALTDENTCMDGFAGRAMDGRLKSAIRARITGVAQVTSNALALVNRFAERH